MMRIILAAAFALAPLAPVFADGERWEFRISNVLSPAEPTAHVELWAHFNRFDYAFAAARLNVLASEPGWVDGSLFEMGHGSSLGTTPGEIIGSDVVDIIAGQIHFAPHIADPTNPILVWEADVTATDFAARTIALETDTSEFIVYPEVTSAASASRLGTLTEGAGEILVIPAPGVAILPLSMATLAAIRRRRT